MSLRITERRITSDATGHVAQRASAGTNLWRVSWLPSQLLDRNDAITAMTLAETVAAHPEPDERTRALIHGWADELWLTADQAIELIQKTRR